MWFSTAPSRQASALVPIPLFFLFAAQCIAADSPDSPNERWPFVVRWASINHNTNVFRVCTVTNDVLRVEYSSHEASQPRADAGQEPTINTTNRFIGGMKRLLALASQAASEMPTNRLPDESVEECRLELLFLVNGASKHAIVVGDCRRIREFIYEKPNLSELMLTVSLELEMPKGAQLYYNGAQYHAWPPEGFRFEFDDEEELQPNKRQIGQPKSVER